MKLLKNYINTLCESLLVENSEFNNQELTLLNNLPEIKSYLSRTLEKIGEGQSRSVYRIQPGEVIKVAKNTMGIEQNTNEINVCKSGEMSNMFPVIRQHHPEFYWLIAEEASPMTRVKFKELTGISWSDFLFVIGGAFPSSLKNPSSGEIRLCQQAFDKYYGNSFVRKVISTIKNCKYEPGDIAKLDSWGIVKNKPVIVDSGNVKGMKV